MTTDISTFKEVLVTIDQIIKAIDHHAKKMGQLNGLTVHQVDILKEMQYNKVITLSSLAKNVSLSQYKLNTVVDSLIERKLIKKARDNTDKRAWIVELTDEGNALMESMFSLKDKFIEKFSKLPSWHQAQILSTLQYLSEMMHSIQ
jgi:DNA-binding MarR family transcriptional regulator